MRLTRRGWLAGAALASAPGMSLATAAPAQQRGATTAPGAVTIPAPPSPSFTVVSRGGGRTDYRPALEALRAYALAELAAVGLPGMTLSVADDEGFVALLPLGWADVENRAPMRSDHLVQIGSISKSFLSLTLLSLADAGKVDLDAPVSRYLPDAALPRQPITPAQVLSHTAGLPDGAPLFPRTPDGRLWCGFTPTTSFSYSNTGYELMGALVEAISGDRIAAVHAQGLRIVGGGGFSPTISQRERPAQAVGYWPWNRWGAETPGMALERATFDPEDTAAGCIAADATAMSGYLRTLMHLGRGQGGGIVSDASARRFVAPAGSTKDAFGPGARYGLGVAIVPVDGKDVLHHTGGMMSFSSSFHADPVTGVGCFASVNARNGEYRPRLTTAYAVRLMRAAKAGAPLPAPPDPRTGWGPEDPELYAGSYSAGDRTLVVTSGPAELQVAADGARGRVFAAAPDRLVTDHPLLTRYGLDVIRDRGRVLGLWWQERYFRAAGAPPGPAPDQALRPYAGTYLNRDPWVGAADVHVRGSRLWLEGGGPLVDRGSYWSLEKDPGGVERFSFEARLNERFQRLSASGRDLLRVTA